MCIGYRIVVKKCPKTTKSNLELSLPHQTIVYVKAELHAAARFYRHDENKQTSGVDPEVSSRMELISFVGYIQCKLNIL